MEDQKTDEEKFSKLLQALEGSQLTLGLKPAPVQHQDPRGYVPLVTTEPVKPKTVYVGNVPKLHIPQDLEVFPPKSIESPKKSGKVFDAGKPLAVDTALELREIILGCPHFIFSQDWKGKSFIFQGIDGPFPYGLVTERAGCHGLVLAMQAFILKQLLFTKEIKEHATYSNPLKPDGFQRKQALINGICEILWNAGEKKRCTVCLLSYQPSFGEDGRYKKDGFTEKIRIYEFVSLEECKMFVHKNLDHFTGRNSSGCILFLYSLVLSRKISSVKNDMRAGSDSPLQLLTAWENITQPLMNLILTGRATHHIHNKDISGDMPHSGIQERSSVGFLFWDKAENDDNRTMVGSMLKTPKYPLWITYVNNQYGLLFHTNADLVSDWRMEHRFSLFYFTALSSQYKGTLITVDTRTSGIIFRKPRLVMLEEEEKIPAMNQCIMSKWFGATLDWNGTPPYV